MNVRIKSRADIKELSSESPFPFKSALISIADHGRNFVELGYKPDFLLQISFDDVDDYFFDDLVYKGLTEEELCGVENKYHIISDEQAQQIADFYRSIKDKARVVYCQCEYGISRSAAVAAAILEYESQSGITVFADNRYSPNKTVFRKVLKAIKGGD